MFREGLSADWCFLNDDGLSESYTLTDIMAYGTVVTTRPVIDCSGVGSSNSEFPVPLLRRSTQLAKLIIAWPFTRVAKSATRAPVPSSSDVIVRSSLKVYERAASSEIQTLDEPGLSLFLPE